MKEREMTVTGQINKDGQLSMYMGELNQFFAANKGKRVFARFYIASDESSEALKGYYYKCIVPSFKMAFWERGERMTEEDTERRLRQMSPIMQIEEVDEKGKYLRILRSVSNLDNAELIEHIETLKQIAAEEFSLYIEDPKYIQS